MGDFNVKAVQDEKELQERRDMQAQINSYRFRLVSSEPDPYQRLIKAQSMTNMFIEKIRLVKNT